MLKIVGIGGTLRDNSRSRVALEVALRAAEGEGASTVLLDLNKLRLPFYEPYKDLDEFGENVKYFVETTGAADGLIISTGAYHGTIAGVTKNALDFCELLEDSNPSYWTNKAVGAIAVAGGTLDASHVITALTHVTHALRGTAISYAVAIPQGKHVFDFDANGIITDEKWRQRLDRLGKLTVEMARKMRPESAFS
jgi:FMN reductase